MNPTDEELLSAYLDGEVTADEQARVERRLAEDAGYRQLHDELRALRQHLESLPIARMPADFSQTVLEAAERQMVAPRRSGANMEPAAAALDSTDGRRWVRPLLWSGLITAAGLMVMIFSPAQRESSTAKVARTDAPQPAVSALAAKAEPSFEAEPSSSIHSEDAIVAAPATPPADLNKQLENRALKMDQPRSGEVAAQEAKDAQGQLRAQDERELEADKRGEGNRRQVVGKASARGGADRDEGKGAERYRAFEALKKEAQKLSDEPRSTPSAPRPAEENAAKSSQQFGLGGAPAPMPPVVAAPADSVPVAPSQLASKVPGAGFAQQAAPATTTAPLGGASGGQGQAAQGPARSAFDVAKGAPRGGEDLKRIETAQKETSPSLNFSVTLTDKGGGQAEFEKLLTSIQPEKKPAGKPQEQQAGAPLQQAAVADALSEGGGKRENGNLASQPQQVYEVELTYGALVDLLAQLRSRPAKYRLDPVSDALGQEVKRRADELVIQRKQEQAKELDQKKVESKLADGKSKDANEKNRSEKSANLDDSGFKGAAAIADKAGSPPAAQLYRVRIVLRRAAVSDPAAAKQAPAPAKAPAP